ncbi:MAG: beta-propeller domain-containing protein, partial [Coriobacteriaceae bacterium]|nr:beta-propeller domain-containing protein [Coriobacteriaceae bacterium]
MKHQSARTPARTAKQCPITDAPLQSGRQRATTAQAWGACGNNPTEARKPLPSPTAFKAGRHAFALWAIALFCLFMLGGCASGQPGKTDEPPTPSGSKDAVLTATSTASSYEDVYAAVERLRRNNVTLFPSGNFGALESVGSAKDLGATDSMSSPAMNASADDAVQTSGDYSTTNVQVAGIDEGDVVKTDGDCIYLASQASVIVAQARGAQTIELARVPLKGINLQEATEAAYVDEFVPYPQEIYLEGDTLIVLYSYTSPLAPADEGAQTEGSSEESPAENTPPGEMPTEVTPPQGPTSSPSNPGTGTSPTTGGGTSGSAPTVAPDSTSSSTSGNASGST